MTLNSFILSMQSPPLPALGALFLLLLAAYGVGTLLLRRFRRHGAVAMREFTAFVLGLDLLALLFRLGERVVCTAPRRLRRRCWRFPPGTASGFC